MARTWLSVTVELLGGRGEELWPPPGRIFAVGPRHTFWDLAAAINDAFARWDRSHLSVFTLTDGRIITDQFTAAEWAGSAVGPITATSDIEVTKVTRSVKLGEEFQFTFDLGDDWIHRCVVAGKKVDPEEQLGVVPDKPLPYWGWGTIPDQYGRNWNGDDGETPTPRRPSELHPMLMHAWPDQSQVAELDMVAVYEAIHANDLDGFLAALTGCDIDDALQLLGSEMPSLLLEGREKTESLTLSIANRLTMRCWDGDDVLASDLVACLRREPLAGRVVPVDLDMFSDALERDPHTSIGGYLDLETGFAYGGDFLDDMIVGKDNAIDIAADPDRWLEFACTGPSSGWRDMADFSRRQRDAGLRERLEQAIEGKGAFRRFLDIVHNDDIEMQWTLYSRERQIGRARAYLAEKGIRVGTPKEGAAREVDDARTRRGK